AGRVAPHAVGDSDGPDAGIVNGGELRLGHAAVVALGEATDPEDAVRVFVRFALLTAIRQSSDVDLGGRMHGGCIIDSPGTARHDPGPGATFPVAGREAGRPSSRSRSETPQARSGIRGGTPIRSRVRPGRRG